MKKVFVIGMAALSLSLSLNVHAAGTAAKAKPLAEHQVNYAEQIKKHIEGQVKAKGSTGKLSAQESRAAIKLALAEINISGAQRNRISDILSADTANLEANLKTLYSIVAVSKMTEGPAQRDQAEAVALKEAADQALKLLENSGLIGESTNARLSDGTQLSKEEMSLAAEGIKKMNQMAAEQLRYDSSSRDVYAQIKAEINKLIPKLGSIEAAYVQAIMNVKKVSKAEAIELAKKFKICE